MDFKYIQNISENVGTILLYKRIGSVVNAHGEYESGISGEQFAEEMLYLQSHCSEIRVRINSAGGSVIEGYSIISAILNSTVPCNTYVDGLAGSIAGIIALAGKKRYIKDFGSLLIHPVSGTDDKEFAQFITNTLTTILENRSNLSKEAINEMIGKETLVNAEDSFGMGLMDEVVPTKNKVKILNTSTASEIANIYNEIINNNNKPSMKKIQDVLNVAEEVTEEQVVTAIENKDAEIATLKEEKVALEESKVELENQLKEFNDAKEAKEAEEAEALKNKATELVENAIKANTLEESEKEATIELAIQNFSAIESMVAKIGNKAKAVKVFNKKDVDQADSEKAKWTMRDWEKKDPKGLEKMHNETPEVFKALYDKEYK